MFIFAHDERMNPIQCRFLGCRQIHLLVNYAYVALVISLLELKF